MHIRMRAGYTSAAGRIAHLVHAVPWIQVVLGHDRNDGPALGQPYAYGPVPVASGLDVSRVEPHREAALLQVVDQSTYELERFWLSPVADEQLLTIHGRHKHRKQMPLSHALVTWCNNELNDVMDTQVSLIYYSIHHMSPPYAIIWRTATTLNTWPKGL